MNINDVIEYLKIRDIACSVMQGEQLVRLMHEVLLANEKFNLTAIKDESSFLEKMILDSALACLDLPDENVKVLDFGTGAGFPGLVLKILKPNINIALMDSTLKKIEFIKEFCEKENIKATLVNARMEEYASIHREEFDFIFARAVSSLPILLELAIPALKVNGIFIAMKAKSVDEEVLASTSALKKLSSHLVKMYVDELPISQEERCLVYILKDEKTKRSYPREYKDIKNKSL